MAERTTGFVCPDWAVPYWNPYECTMMSCTDGDYAAVDHSLQVTVYVAGSAQEVSTFLSQQRNGGVPSQQELLMREFEAAETELFGKPIGML